MNILKDEKNFNNTKFDFSDFHNKYKALFPNNLLLSENFLYWMIGFTEGGGSFIVNKRGDLAFIITQSTKDINILYYIQEILGFGKVIAQSSTISRYVTQSKREIDIIISIFNGNLILPTRKKQLNLFIKGFNEWVTKGRIRLEPIVIKNKDHLPKLSNTWLTGFTDGEGCFSSSINNKHYTFNFSIAQKGEINLNILEKICLLFKGGKVSKHSVKNVYEYRINGIKNCSNIFWYFDKYKLLTKKSISYILWKEIHKNFINKDHLNKKKRLEMMERVRIINKYNID
jgi:hypothetical protein